MNGTTAARLRPLAAALAAGAAFGFTPVTVEDDWIVQARVRDSAGPDPSIAVTVASDAAGGCNGIVEDDWGFHTACEAQPWWQVDLGAPRRIRSVVLHNRPDAMAGRAARIEIQISDDGRAFRTVHRHDGTVFQATPGDPPLTVPLDGVTGRWVRLQLPGRDYLHLREVQILGDDGTNLALGRPATQSSVSTWSRAHGAPAKSADPWIAAARQAVGRGRVLAEHLAARGVAVGEATTALARAAARIPTADAGDEARAKEAFLGVRAAVRVLAFMDPRLDFDSVVFVRRAPGVFPHLSDQHYGWWSRPGGGVYVLEGLRSGAPRLRCLTSALPEGSVSSLDLSPDGHRALFAWCRYHPGLADLRSKADKTQVPEDAFHHLYEVNLDGSGLRQITRGRYDDFDGRYLPGGDLVFLSTRKGTFLQCTAANSRRTLEADLPDSYVRCGGDDYRPVPVFTLHRSDAAGRDLRPISAFETFEYSPWVADDGRLLYCRWDYIDRFNGHFFSLWSSDQDGANAQLVYGNYTVRPQATMEPRSIPGSRKLVFTASAHHSITGGSLVLLDPTRGMEDLDPLVRLTPEVPFPETERNVGSYYAAPWPLAEDLHLVSWSSRALPPHCRVDSTDRNPVNAQGIYLFDASGNLELIHRDAELSSTHPIPVRPRATPFRQPDDANPASPPCGRFVVRDVQAGLEGIAPGTVRNLRIVGVTPKVQPRMNQPSLGVSHEETAKYVLGTVPVEADGSAHFVVPSGIPFFFQALDAEGRAVQTMRSLTAVLPGRTLACIGCHESRYGAPTTGRPPAALARAPSRPTPGPDGTWPLSFASLVQPVLDRACVACHRPGTEGARFDLTPPRAHDSLLVWADKDLHKLAFEKDRSIAGESPSLRSRLPAYLRDDPVHRPVKLTDDDRARLYAWMDLYAPVQGFFSPEQERELAGFRTRMEGLMAAEAARATGP